VVLGSPFGFTEPLRVAPEDVRLVAGDVVTVGVAGVVKLRTEP
jgi:protein involved in polysaccharide export with SLBB domain